MSRSTSESDDAVLAKDQAESPLPEESNCGGNSNGGLVLKKGPWTAAEDAILIEYVKKHGEGNWNAVQKHSGLFRCGKSCRLRWANHLRPNLKKGAFTQEEEHLIIELHAKIGNKWARMAAHLPGRTDNEIKNYWNTRIKRRQRAGLPLYPPEVSFQAMRKSQQGLTIGGIDSGDKVHHDFLQHTNSYEIPDLVFDSLKANHGISPYIPELPDISSSSLMMKGLGSSQYSSFITPTMHRQKRLRESTTLLSGYSGSMKNEYLLLDQFQNDTSDKVAPSFGLNFTLDSGPVVAKTPESIVENEGSHTFSNCNFSASRSTSGAVKLELPSLQYPDTELGSWGTSSPPPLLDPVDTFILSPPTAGVESNCPSPRNSGLLDALLHEAKALSNAKNNSSDKSSNSSTVTPGDIADTSTLNICEAEWEDYGEPLSPLGHTATSLFNECTPVSASGSSLDEQPPAETIAGCDAKLEQPVLVWAAEREKETTEQLNVTRPDALLAADWLEHSSSYVKDQGTMTDAIASLLGDDLSNDYRLMTAEPSASAHEWGLGSCAWNNMPAVCQMSELP